MIIEIKTVGIEDSKSSNNLLLQSDAEKSPKIQSAPQGGKPTVSKEKPLKKRGTKRKIVKIQSFKYPTTTSFRRMLPYDLRNTSFARTNSQFSLEIPQGVPRDQLNELNNVLYSFYQRVGKQFVNTLIDKYYESGRTNPHWHIPENDQQDKVTLRATYDRHGNVIRVRTLEAARFRTHSQFFLEAINQIQKIPNPPEILLNDIREFNINYSLNLNQRP